MADRLWSGVDDIPGIGTVTWTVKIVDDGGTLVQIFDEAVLAGGELTDEQLNEVERYLQLKTAR